MLSRETKEFLQVLAECIKGFHMEDDFLKTGVPTVRESETPVNETQHERNIK